MNTQGSLVVAALAVAFTFLTSGCSEGAWNNPHPADEAGKNILYSNFSGPPKHLDPVISYSSDEGRFIDQIYDPPLQYHYLKRPFELEPNTLSSMPEIVYLDAEGNEVASDSPDLAYSDYLFELTPGIYYQPHPALALDTSGAPVYAFESLDDAEPYSSLNDR